MEQMKKLRDLFEAYRPAGGPTLSKGDVAKLLADQDAADSDSRHAVRMQQAEEASDRKPGARVTFGADTVYGKGGFKESEYEPAQESLGDYKRRMMMGLNEPEMKKTPKPSYAKPPADVMRFDDDEIKGGYSFSKEAQSGVPNANDVKAGWKGSSQSSGGPGMSGSAFARLLKKLGE